VIHDRLLHQILYSTHLIDDFFAIVATPLRHTHRSSMTGSYGDGLSKNVHRVRMLVKQDVGFIGNDKLRQVNLQVTLQLEISQLFGSSDDNFRDAVVSGSGLMHVLFEIETRPSP